jgi:hypothetical protein
MPEEDINLCTKEHKWCHGYKQTINILLLTVSRSRRNKQNVSSYQWAQFSGTVEQEPRD